MNKKVWTAVSAVMGIAIVGVVLWGIFGTPKKTKAVEAPTNGQAEVIVHEKVIENFVEVEREITAEIIQDGLRDMGILVTQEYYFTEVAHFSKSATKWLIVNAESSYTGSYDGVITAGIDFQKIKVNKSESSKTIYVVLPAAELQMISVDPNSFILYEEKNTWGSHVSAEEFNETLIGLEEHAKAKAIEKGLLEKADANAQTIVRNFVSSMFDPGEYTIEITTQ